jgi:hypothetical protein
LAEATVFVMNEDEYAKLTRSPNGDVAKDLVRRGEKLKLLARKQVGKGTGALAMSIRVTLVPSSNSDPVVYIGSDNRIALIHHEGTRPHPIAAKPGRMLRFAHRGKIVYAHAVMHPGTRPNHYLSDNLRRVVVD